MLMLGGLQFLLSFLKVALLYRYGKTHRLKGNFRTLVVRGNISPTINVRMSERVTEFRALVRTQKIY